MPSEVVLASIQTPDGIWNAGEDDPPSSQVQGSTVTVSGTFNDFAAGTESEGSISVTC